MASKKRKYTEQELKDKLWEMVQTVDWEEDDIYDLTEHDDYENWVEAMASRDSKVVSIGLTASTIDLSKIAKAMEDNGLSDRLVRSFRQTVKHAISTAQENS